MDDGILCTNVLEGIIVLLKPIFEKAPLTNCTALGLRPGQVKVELPELQHLLDMCAEVQDQPAMWEGMLRAGAVLGMNVMKNPVAGLVNAALDTQQEDGSLPMDMEQSVAVLRAAFAMYESRVDRELLTKLARWCGFAAANWEQVIACAAIRQHAADLMELLENMYRVTGKKALLTMMEKLRREAMDWSGVLHTFAVQRPMARVTAWEDMEAGLKAEQGNEQGLYTRQYLTCHGESLADGARSAAANGLYSGSGMELTAAKTGWERISRYHGAVCGGLTCNENVAGASPREGVDAAALGAWAEAFCAVSETGSSAWAFDALDVMLKNAMARAVKGAQLIDLQRVNSLADQCGDAGAYHLHAGTERKVRALSRLLRGYAAACAHAVTAEKNGLAVNLLMQGKYAVAVNDQAVTVTVDGTDDKMMLKLHMPKAAKLALHVRVPAWTKDACITVNQEGGDEGKPGTYLTIEREWHDGDVVTVELEQTLRTVAGHHQSLCVMKGAQLLTMPAAADAAWAVGLCGKPEMVDGSVVCRVVPITWNKRGAVPADLPVLPKANGEAVQVKLVPYADHCGITLFPQVEA